MACPNFGVFNKFGTSVYHKTAVSSSKTLKTMLFSMYVMNLVFHTEFTFTIQADAKEYICELLEYHITFNKEKILEYDPALSNCIEELTDFFL